MNIMLYVIYSVVSKLTPPPQRLRSCIHYFDCSVHIFDVVLWYTDCLLITFDFSVIQT